MGETLCKAVLVLLSPFVSQPGTGVLPRAALHQEHQEHQKHATDRSETFPVPRFLSSRLDSSCLFSSPTLSSGHRIHVLSLASIPFLFIGRALRLPHRAGRLPPTSLGYCVDCAGGNGAMIITRRCYSDTRQGRDRTPARKLMDGMTSSTVVLGRTFSRPPKPVPGFVPFFSFVREAVAESCQRAPSG